MPKRASGPKKKFAFWSYDRFPYVLGAPGTLRDDGWFEPDGYDGHMFKPVRIFDKVADGRAAHAKLVALTAERTSILAALEAGFKERLLVLTPWTTQPWMREARKG